MKQTILVVAASLGLLLTGCGEDRSKSAPDTSGERSAVIPKKTLVKMTYLTGTIQGTLDEKSFALKGTRREGSAIQTQGDQSTLSLQFAKGMEIIVLDAGNYTGKGEYGKHLNVIWQTMDNAGKLMEVKRKYFTVTQDTPEIVAGEFDITVLSAMGKEKHLKGSFEMQKLHFNENDAEGILKRIKQDEHVILSLDPKWRTDKASILKAFEANKKIFAYIDEPLRADKSFILQLLEYNPKAGANLFYHMDEKLKGDKAFMLQLIKINPKSAASIYYMADEKIRQDKAFALKVLSYNKAVMRMLPKSLQADADIRKAAGKK